MAAASPAPRKRAPAKKAAPKKPQGRAGTAPAVPALPPGVVDDGLSIGQWVADLHTSPRRIEVFDRKWEFKQPTGGRGLQWDALLAASGIRAALASMMFDEESVPDRVFTDAQGQQRTIPGGPGTARADEFIAAATEWVPTEAAEEFWNRLERAIFGPGEASAS